MQGLGSGHQPLNPTLFLSFFFFYSSAAPLSQVSLLFGLVLTQARMSMAFPRQEYWSGLPFPTPGDLPNQGSNLSVLHWQAGSLLPYYLESPSASKCGKKVVKLQDETVIN